MSPTTAGRALHRLAERGYVARETVAVTEGEVRDVPVWSVRSPRPGLAAGRGDRRAGGAARGARAEASPPPRSTPGRRRPPGRLAHLLWNEDLGSLDVERHAVLLAAAAG